MAVAGLSADFAPYSVAHATGIDARNCVDINVVTSIKPPDIPAAMVSKSVDGTGLNGTAERSARSGVPVVVVAQFATHTSESLLTAPGIKSLTQLAGKKIISSPATDTPTITLNGILDEKAPSVAKNYTLVPIASVSGRDAAFLSHAGTGVLAPYNLDLQMESKLPGSKILASPTSLPAAPSTGLAVTRSYLASHKKVVEDVMKAVDEAQQLIKTNPKKAEKVFKGVYGITASEAKTFYKYDLKTITFNLVPTTAEYKEEATLDTESSKGQTWTPSDVKAQWTTKLASTVTRWWKKHSKS